MHARKEKDRMREEPGLTFVGTSHIDPDGYEALLGRLSDIRPDVVLLEVSWFSVLFRRTVARLLLKMLHGNIRALGITASHEINNIILYLEMPYEYRAARNYRERTGARVHCIDIPHFSFLRLARAYRVVTKKNLLLLAALPGDRARQEKQLAKKIFSSKERHLADMILSRVSKDRLAVLREQKLVKKVSRFLRKYDGRRVAYVGGWEHMIEDPQKRTLYSMLGGAGAREIVFLK